uniref:Uncharacterized protein n=1 Tax=Panagrolaimus sp. PS1159 TaxID=55785 RepID=A0AC35G448_9BILA
MSGTPSPIPSPCHTNTSTVFKIRRSPLSLFFPSFNRSTASTTSTDKSPTSPSPLASATGKRAKFRNANSMDTTRSDEEGKPKKNGYRALLTPEPFGKITLPSTVSFSSSENIRNGATKVTENKPSKSVSFHDLIVYPAAIHQAIQSLSSPRKSICQKMTSLSINSNLNLAGSAETPKIKRSFSNYYIRCKFCLL